MTRWMLAAAVATTLSLLATVPSFTDQYGPAPLKEDLATTDGPRLEIEEPRYDWGSIYQGETAENEFRLANSGNEPLVITRIKGT